VWVRQRLTYASEARRGASSVRVASDPGHRGCPGRSTMLRQRSGALEAPCYFPVIRSWSPGPSSYHPGPPSTEVHSVMTDVRVRGEVRRWSEWHRIWGIRGIRGGPRRYSNALGHQEPLVISLLFDPGAPDHQDIVGDLPRRRCVARRPAKRGGARRLPFQVHSSLQSLHKLRQWLWRILLLLLILSSPLSSCGSSCRSSCGSSCDAIHPAIRPAVRPAIRSRFVLRFILQLVLRFILRFVLRFILWLFCGLQCCRPAAF